MKEKIIQYPTIVAVMYWQILKPSYLIFGVLLFCFIFDFITALLKSAYNNELIDKDIAWKGVCKKLNSLMYVFVGITGDIMLRFHFDSEESIIPLTAGIITFLVLNELTSICKNIANTDNDMPELLKSFFDKFKG